MMSRGVACKSLASFKLATVGSRSFSTVVTARAVTNEGPATILGNLNRSPVAAHARDVTTFWIRAPVVGARNVTTMSLREKEQQQEEKQSQSVVAANGGNNNEEKENEISSYWGVPPSKVTKDDGTEWRWSCFRVSFAFLRFWSLFFFFFFFFIKWI